MRQNSTSISHVPATPPMRFHPLIRPLSSLLLLWLLCSACSAREYQGLCIKSLQGDLHTLRVELAETPEARTKGLMHRTELAADQGMLFDFEREQRVSMWMKNTPLPLDMLFIADSGRILRIEQDTEPFSLRSIASGRPARAVLEVNAGTSKRLNIRSGDHVLHPLFGSDCES